MARGNVADERKKEKTRKVEGERVACILALSLFAAIYFMIHARALTATHNRGHTQASGVLGTLCPAEWKNVIFSDKWTMAARGRDVRLNTIVYFVLDCPLIPICDVSLVYRS